MLGNLFQTSRKSYQLGILKVIDDVTKFKHVKVWYDVIEIMKEKWFQSSDDRVEIFSAEREQKLKKK